MNTISILATQYTCMATHNQQTFSVYVAQSNKQIHTVLLCICVQCHWNKTAASQSDLSYPADGHNVFLPTWPVMVFDVRCYSSISWVFLCLWVDREYFWKSITLFITFAYARFPLCFVVLWWKHVFWKQSLIQRNSPERKWRPNSKVNRDQMETRKGVHVCNT